LNGFATLHDIVDLAQIKVLGDKAKIHNPDTRTIVERENTAPSDDSNTRTGGDGPDEVQDVPATPNASANVSKGNETGAPEQDKAPVKKNQEGRRPTRNRVRDRGA
jgi:hypothetical protein